MESQNKIVENKIFEFQKELFMLKLKRARNQKFQNHKFKLIRHQIATLKLHQHFLKLNK